MTFLYIVIALVIVFDFINGFHDSANSIASDPVVINLSVMGGSSGGSNLPDSCNTGFWNYWRNHLSAFQLVKLTLTTI
ncbi:MAG: hypothetical protein ACOXZV_11380 [Bacteroidales bacterium]